MSRVLVLGGAGFIGTHLTAQLLREEREVWVIDRHARQPSMSQLHWLERSVSSSDLVELIDKQNIDLVFHLAGSATVAPSLADPARDLDFNATTTLAVTTALRHTARPPLLVFTSSAAVYGDSGQVPWSEDQPLKPMSPYGISKLAAEHYVRLHAESYGLPAFSARPFSVYGPGQRKLVVHDLLSRLSAGENPLTVAGSPEIERDFVFVGDVVEALIRLASVAPAKGEPYNIATGIGTRLGDLVANLIRMAAPAAEFTFTETLRPGDPLRMVGDTALASRFGVTCDTPLEFGLRRTVEWFQQDGAIGSS